MTILWAIFLGRTATFKRSSCPPRGKVGDVQGRGRIRQPVSCYQMGALDSEEALHLLITSKMTNIGRARVVLACWKLPVNEKRPTLQLLQT
jgi:hypothetical protein